MTTPRNKGYGKAPHETDVSERGFALLLVLLMAAAVAFSLYTQIPRVGFESMREKEQLLMDRGNQYKRAIQVFYAVNKRYPARMEELENTNDKRFLRRRYKDPLTGKDEWRLIHTNGSYLTDSLVQKPPAQNAANGTPGAGILPGGGPLGTNNMNSQPGAGNSLGLFAGGATGGNTATGGNNGGINNGVPQPAALNLAAQRRPSDRLIPGDGTTTSPPTNAQPDNGVPGSYPPNFNPANFNPNDPSTWPPITLAPPNSGQPGQPAQLQPNGQPVPTAQPSGIPGFGGQNTLNGQPSGAQITAQPFGQTQPFGVQPLQQTGPGLQLANGQQTVPGQPTINTPLPFGPQPVNTGSDGSINVQPPPGQPAPGVPGQASPFTAPSPQVFNPGFGFNGSPFAPDSGQAPVGSPAPNAFGNQPQPAGNQAAGNLAGQQNPAGLTAGLQTINNQLSSPGGIPASVANPQAAPGIAGVASTFEGVGIKIYHERSKYKEWEFVFDPATAGPTTQPAPGQNNPAGQPGQAGAPASGATANPFGQTPNPFGPNSGQPQSPSGQAPAPAVPAANPFGATPGLFGQ